MSSLYRTLLDTVFDGRSPFGFACMLGSLLIGPAALAGPKEPPASAKVDYLRDVRPILAEKCFPCHGLDEKARQAGLRLDTPEGWRRKASSGKPVIAPGRPEASVLLHRVTAPGAMQMPPPSLGRPLKPEETALLKRWIQQGAPYAPHWAFRKPVRPPVPKVRQAGWGRNEIDAFILARLEQAGLKPSPEADRYTLIRRLSLDLIGLPPTPQEVDAFLADRSPNAYERLVDRLLASPRFGERWVRMWLDLARYADSAGYGSDPLRPNLWPYRDWVINAFNRNLPYDRFTIEQLAGDLLPNPTQDQIIATAFHRNTMTNTEGGTDDEEFRMAAVKDRAITTAQVWMGLTLGCAQCHSHKFDPISQKEFYRFLAFFNQTEDNDQPDERPTLPLPTEEQKRKLAALEKELADLEAMAASKPELKPDVDKKKKELAAAQPVALPILRELPPEKRRPTYVLTLGNFLQPGEKVEAATPAAFPAPPPDAPRSRLGVARWLVSRENPLTARVAVNRFWAQLFGVGLVETEEDFGTQGALPSHPELLDWLAVRFAEGVQVSMYSGIQEKPVGPKTAPLNTRRPEHLNTSPPWDTKALLKLMVMSATYRQSSKVTPTLLERDPRNRLLARFPRRRLEAEAVRDQALALSGLLSAKIGGPSVYPPQPEGLWQAAFNGERTWPTSAGEDRYRRGLYTFWRRTVPYPSLATFDAPSREICALRRQPTNTPLQALVTLNDPAYLEMAQALGRRIAREGGSSPEARVRFALRLVLARPPQPEAVTTLLALYRQELARYQADEAAAKRLATEPLGPLPEGMNPAEQAAWTVVANVLLNLDGVLMKS